jgi:hypothetical protein
MAVSKKEDKNKKEEKKPNTENDWEGFGYACIRNFIITMVYALIGANFLFYIGLKKQDNKNKKDTNYKKKLNEYFRLDNEYYHCLRDPEDNELRCTNTLNITPYKYYTHKKQDETGGGDINLLEESASASASASADKDIKIDSDAAPVVAPVDAPVVAPVDAPVVDAAPVDAPVVAPVDAPVVDAAPVDAAPVVEVAPVDAAPVVEVKGGGEEKGALYDDEDCDETEKEKLKKIVIHESDNSWFSYFLSFFDFGIFNFLIKSIANTYYSERKLLHTIYSKFCRKESNSTLHMFIGVIITIILFAFTFIIGFFNFFIQTFLLAFKDGKWITYIICLILLITPIAIIIGIEQLFEFLIKMLISPLIEVESRKDIFNIISSEQQLLIFVFSVLTISSAFTHLTNEISVPMTICYGLFLSYNLYYSYVKKE